MNYRPLVLLLFVGLMLGGCARLAQKPVETETLAETSPMVEPTQPVIVGGDTDEHGCIGSAGYTWCEPLQKCLRLFEEACVPQGMETSDLEAVVKEQIIAKRGTVAESLAIITQKLEGNYAMGSANDPEAMMGGGMWFAALVNGEWQLVWDGNGAITCAELTNYPDLPASMIPECYDTASEEMITR